MNYFLLAPLGLLYVIAFILAGIFRPKYAMAAIFAAAPFQNDLSIGGPVRFSLTEINLLLSVPVMLFHLGRLRVGPTFFPAVGYLAACALSITMGQFQSAVTCLVQTFLYLILAVAVFATLAKSAEDYSASLDGYLWVCVFVSTLVCVQRTGFVLQLHKNGIGDSLAVGVVIALELSLGATTRGARFRYLAMLALNFVAMIITLSRGAWMAAGAGALFVLILRREFRLLLRILFVMVPIAFIAWQLLDADSKSYAFGFDRDRDNIKWRLDSIEFALRKFRESPLLGAGVGLRKEYDCTNVALLLLAETGIVGAIPFIFLHLTVAVSSLSYSLTIPRKTFPFSVIVIGGALVFGKLAHGLVDHYWSRGALSASWAAFGMAARIASEKSRQRSRMLREQAMDRVDASIELSSAPDLPCSTAEACI